MKSTMRNLVLREPGMAIRGRGTPIGFRRCSVRRTGPAGIFSAARVAIPSGPSIGRVIRKAAEVVAAKGKGRKAKVSA